jgi:hypothetical protein
MNRQDVLVALGRILMVPLTVCLLVWAGASALCTVRIQPDLREQAAAYWQECARTSLGVFESTCEVQVKELFGQRVCPP